MDPQMIRCPPSNYSQNHYRQQQKQGDRLHHKLKSLSITTVSSALEVCSSSILWVRSSSHVVSTYSITMIVRHWQQINGHFCPMSSTATMHKISTLVSERFSTKNHLCQSNCAQKRSIRSISSVNRSNASYHSFVCRHIFINSPSMLNNFSNRTISSSPVQSVDILLHVKCMHFVIRHTWPLVLHCTVKITWWNVRRTAWDGNRMAIWSSSFCLYSSFRVIARLFFSIHINRVIILFMRGASGCQH